MNRIYAWAPLDVDLGDEDYSAEVVEDVSEAEANLVTSMCDDDPTEHAPVLDIDIPHKLIPSTTQGHSHLYLDIKCSWGDYVDFLEAAAKIGLLEQGYVKASIDRGFTAVRKPGVKKIKVSASQY